MSTPDAVGTYPRSVTPGIETQSTPQAGIIIREYGQQYPEPGVYVGLDWVRCTGPESIRRFVERYLDHRFGGKPKSCRGAQWFKQGLIWEPGVMLSWGHRSEICQLDIQGGRLKQMTGGDRIELLRQIMALGMKPTRIDGALDWVNQDVFACVAATESCKRGELCTLRRYRLNDGFTKDNVPTRRHLNLGSRDSAVCVRIYDKGLEQGVAPSGYWERLEVEWKADRAQEVGNKLYYAGDSWPDLLVSLIFGAVDFREINGRSELDRRPQAAWWSRLIDGRETIRVAPASEDESFEKWAGWFRMAAGSRLLELAAAVRVPVADVVEWLLNGVEVGNAGGPIVEQFRQFFKIGEYGRASE